MSDRISPHPAKIHESGEWPSLAKAPVLGTGDREFESPLPDNYISFLRKERQYISFLRKEREFSRKKPSQMRGLSLFSTGVFSSLAADRAGTGRCWRWHW